MSIEQRSVRVLSLPENASEEKIRTEFEACGDIEKIILGQQECIIIFTNEEAAQSAQAYDGIDIFGCGIEIKIVETDNLEVKKIVSSNNSQSDYEIIEGQEDKKQEAEEQKIDDNQEKFKIGEKEQQAQKEEIQVQQQKIIPQQFKDKDQQAINLTQEVPQPLEQQPFQYQVQYEEPQQQFVPPPQEQQPLIEQEPKLQQNEEPPQVDQYEKPQEPQYQVQFQEPQQQLLPPNQEEKLFEQEVPQKIERQQPQEIRNEPQQKFVPPLQQKQNIPQIIGAQETEPVVYKQHNIGSLIKALNQVNLPIKNEFNQNDIFRNVMSKDFLLICVVSWIVVQILSSCC